MPAVARPPAPTVASAAGRGGRGGTGAARTGADVATAYISGVSRVACYAAVSAVVYRAAGAEGFALLALVRGTVGLLQYLTAGLVPAVTRHLSVADARRQGGADPAADPRADAGGVYATAVGLGLVLGAAGVGLALLYALLLGEVHRVGPDLLPAGRLLAAGVGVGVVLRLLGGVPGAAAQVRGRIRADNLIVGAGEVVWPVGTLAAAWLAATPGGVLAWCGASFLAAKLLTLLARGLLARRALGAARSPPRRALVLPLLSFGGWVLLSELASFFYAPLDYAVINRLLDPLLVAAYAPTVEINGAMALVTGSISLALAPADRRRLRRGAAGPGPADVPARHGGDAGGRAAGRGRRAGLGRAAAAGVAGGGPAGDARGAAAGDGARRGERDGGHGPCRAAGLRAGAAGGGVGRAGRRGQRGPERRPGAGRLGPARRRDRHAGGDRRAHRPVAAVVRAPDAADGAARGGCPLSGRAARGPQRARSRSAASSIERVV